MYDAVRREVHPGHIKITILRERTPENENSTYEIKDLAPTPSPTLSAVNNDENELDLTNYFPVNSNQRKSPSVMMNSKEKILIERQPTSPVTRSRKVDDDQQTQRSVKLLLSKNKMLLNTIMKFFF